MYAPWCVCVYRHLVSVTLFVRTASMFVRACTRRACVRVHFSLCVHVFTRVDAVQGLQASVGV